MLKSFFIIMLSVLALVSCSQNSQYTKKLAADPFVAPLNSKTTKMVALDLKAGQKIAWLALNRSADYNYFQVEQVRLNGKNFIPDKAGPKYVFNSFPPVAAIAGAPKESATTVYVTITFKAKQPHLDDKPNDSFKAYLEVVLEGSGKQGAILINLEGYVRGVCDDCTLALDKSFKYNLEDNDGDGQPDFGLFLCDSKALTKASVEINNQPSAAEHPDFQIPEDSKSTSPYRFDFVNLTGDAIDPWLTKPIPDFFTFYTSEKKPDYIVIDAGAPGGDNPSIPPFKIPVPGGKPVAEVPVLINPSFQTACAIDKTTKSFTCSDENDSGIDLDVFDDLLQTNLLTLTTTGVKVESSDCPNFGTWTGSGVVDGKGPLKLIAAASVPVVQTEKSVTDSEIQGAVIVAVIKLVPATE